MSRSHDSVRSSLYRVKSLLIKAVHSSDLTNSDVNAGAGRGLDGGPGCRAAARGGANRGGGER
jgi:hypothetical protein